MTGVQGDAIAPIVEKTHPIGNGTQRLYRFDNGLGASVVQFTLSVSGLYSMDGSHGAAAGLWELAVIRWSGDAYELTYDTPITDDVLGHLSEDEVQGLLRSIRDLPAPATQDGAS